MQKETKSVLISVYNKDGLSAVIESLNKNSYQIVSTGGTENYGKLH